MYLTAYRDIRCCGTPYDNNKENQIHLQNPTNLVSIVDGLNVDFGVVAIKHFISVS